MRLHMLSWRLPLDERPGHPGQPVAGGRESETHMARKEATPTPSYDVWALVRAVLPVADRLLLVGPSGTGKTHVATEPRPDKRRVYSITLTADTAAAELRGHYIPREGSFLWQDGPAVAAWREGGTLVLNEIDQAGPDAVAFLLAMLDGGLSARLTLPTGETLTPTDGFRVVGTMNGNPDTDLLPALRDRFAVCVKIEAPSPEAFAALPSDLQEPARNTAVIADPQRRVSIRAWLAYARLREVVNEETACRAVFGAQATEIMDALTLARS